VAVGYVFDQARLAIRDDNLNLGSGTFYMTLVTANPNISTVTFVSDLTQVSGGSYAVATLTGVSRPASLTNGQAILTFTGPTPTFPALYASAATAVVGTVVAKQAGGSPVAASDRCISFQPLVTTSASATIASVTTYNGLRVLTSAATTNNVTSTTNSTATLTTSGGGFSPARIGSVVTGTGIPVGTTVTWIASDNNSLLMSQAATGSSSITATFAAGALIDVRVGSAITGTGIPASTTVISVAADGTSLVMSQAATASAAVTVTTTTDVLTTRAMPTSVGSAIDYTITLPSTGVIFL